MNFFQLSYLSVYVSLSNNFFLMFHPKFIWKHDWISKNESLEFFFKLRNYTEARIMVVNLKKYRLAFTQWQHCWELAVNIWKDLEASYQEVRSSFLLGSIVRVRFQHTRLPNLKNWTYHVREPHLHFGKKWLIDSHKIIMTFEYSIVSNAEGLTYCFCHIMNWKKRGENQQYKQCGIHLKNNKIRCVK